MKIKMDPTLLYTVNELKKLERYWFNNRHIENIDEIVDREKDKVLEEYKGSKSYQN